MQPEAEQLLARLQERVESDLGWLLRFPNHEDGGELQPLVWDETAQGPLSPIALLQSRGWLQLESDLADATDRLLEAWWLPEQVGAVHGARWLVPEVDRAGILLDPTQQAARKQQYERLLQELAVQLPEAQIWRLSYDAEYELRLLVGPLRDQPESWIGIAPWVPVATPDRDAPIRFEAAVPMESAEQSVEQSAEQSAELATAIELGEVQIYGYYGGGYDQVHRSGLVQATGKNRDQAIEQVLRRAGFWQTGRFVGLAEGANAEERDRLAGLMAELERLSDRSDLTVYRFSFWNQEQVYVLGHLNASIWGGVELSSRFTYNP